MKELIEQIERFKQEFEKLKPLKPEDQQRLDKKFRLEWNYNSNHIEGNTLTYGETELLLIFGQTKGNHELREYEEMKGHDVALKMIEDLAADKERTLTENFIREINSIILKEPFYKEAITPDGQPTRRLIKVGDYKSFPNSVRLQNGEMFHYASVQETPAMMNDLLQWYEKAATDNSKHPIEVAAELHYRFVRIHPFDDGNGRISRLIMNYHLLKNDLPPVIIKSVDKKNYLFALHEADTGNEEAFTNYILAQLIWSYETAVKAAKGESVDESGDWEKEVEIFKRGAKSKEAIEIKKSKTILEKIIVFDAGKLFDSIDSKIKIFDELFNEKRIHVNFSLPSSFVIRTKEQIIKKIPDFVNDNMNEFFFSFFFNNYKYNGFDDFSVYRKILFTFNQLYYEISYGTDADESSFIRKKYSEELSDEEINQITTVVSNSLLIQIKTHPK